MENYKEDINQDIGAIIFVILFSLLVLIFSGKSGQQASHSSNYYLQNEMAFGNIPFHCNATLVNLVTLPDPCKIQVCVSDNTGLNLFSLDYIVSSYNRSTDQELIDIQKARLQIEPLLLWRVYYLLPLSGKADPAFLS